MKTKYIIAIAAFAMLTACSSEDPNKKAAEDMYQRASEAFDAGNNTLALSLMDSIDKQYGEQVEVRRKLLNLRPRAIERATLTQICAVDSMLAQAQLEISQLQPMFKHISGGELEGYYVVADAYNPNFINSTGIEPRINDSNMLFYAVAQNRGKKIGLNGFALSSASEEMSSDLIPAGSARIDVVEGCELASFLPEEVEALGQWASQNQVKSAALIGASGKQTIKLNDKEAAAFGKAWRYANALQRERQARINREKQERVLQVARDQIANTTADNQP